MLYEFNEVSIVRGDVSISSRVKFQCVFEKHSHHRYNIMHWQVLRADEWLYLLDLGASLYICSVSFKWVPTTSLGIVVDVLTAVP